VKSYAIFYLLFVNIQCIQLYIYLKKTSKFKLLYLLNRISCFNKICRICYVNTHVHIMKVWLKYVQYLC